MKIKLFNEFFTYKVNNKKGDLIKEDDIINCIKKNGVIYSEIISNSPNNKKETPLKPLDIDQYGNITILFNNKEEIVKLENVIRLEF